MKSATLFVALFVLASSTAASAQECTSFTGVRPGTSGIDQGYGKTCGFWGLIVPGANPEESMPAGLVDTWYKMEVGAPGYLKVSMPMGRTDGETCPRYPAVDMWTPWAVGVSSLFVRKEFELTAEFLAVIDTLTIYYIVQDDLVKTYLNEQMITPRRRFHSRDSGCLKYGRYNWFDVPASALKVGKNVLATQALKSAGLGYFDIGFDFKSCSGDVDGLHQCSQSNGLGAGSGRCRTRCDEQDSCRNKDAAECEASFKPDVEGECMCTTGTALGCSGAFEDAPPGVCYESEWTTSQVSRMSFCPPAIDSTCW